LSRAKAVAIFGSSGTEPHSPDWIDAESAGARCAGAGLGVITGGYGGTMEAVSKGAALVGGHVIGVTAPGLFQDRPGANRYVTEEIEARSLSERIGILTDLASGVIALPGSIGTAAELVIAWNINYISRRANAIRLPTVAVGQRWHALTDFLTSQIGADPGDVHVVDTADEAVDWLLAQPEIRCIQSPNL